jgi:hypothetical protein
MRTRTTFSSRSRVTMLITTLAAGAAAAVIAADRPRPRFEIVSRTWHWTDHVEVVATVDPDVEVGNYAIFIDNPETGADTCVTQEVDGEDVPCFTVLD